MVTLCALLAGATVTAEASSERASAAGLRAFRVRVRVREWLTLILFAGEQGQSSLVLDRERRRVVVGHVDLDVLGISMVSHGRACRICKDNLQE